jgi:hypothetical protein
MTTLFERLSRDQPPPTKKAQKPEPAQLLLTWLQKWPKQIVRSKDIYQFGPYSLRFDRENAIRSAETLARLGWLTALETRQRNHRIWKIVRKEPTVHLRVAD